MCLWSSKRESLVCSFSVTTERVAEALSSRFELLKTIDKSSLAQETGVFGYAGKHLILTPGGDRVPPGCEDVVGLGFEVQIRTVLLSIQALLSAPNPDDPLATDVAKHYKENEKDAQRVSREWTEKYATA